jgi:hypothetical protein
MDNIGKSTQFLPAGKDDLLKKLAKQVREILLKED